MLARVRSAARKVAAPVAAQGVTAATSLALQVIAVHTLGLTEFGAFALLLGVLVAGSALYTGYVGDSLAVLDRHDAAVRGALVTSALAAWTLAAVAGVCTVLVLRGGEAALVLSYAALLVVWLLRETLRRLLIARQEFTRLLVNDIGYLLATVAALWVLAVAGGMSLVVLCGAMAIGAVVAVGAGVVGLPRSELRVLTPGLRGMRELAGFASWRAAHATLRPLALLAARVLVGAFFGLAAVGLLEAARLVVAPLQVVLNGAGSYLLPGYAAAERSREGRPDAGRTAVLLVGGTLVVGAGCAALAGPLGRLITGVDLPALLVLGWVAYLAVWAAGLPYVSEVVARKLSRPTFTIRLADSLAGLALVVVALLAGAGMTAVPWLMAVGGLYSVFRLNRLAARTR
jgi:O-antigen/teichoic acid export membrane protein